MDTIVFRISVTSCLLLVYRNMIDFCVTLYSVTFINSVRKWNFKKQFANTYTLRNTERFSKISTIREKIVKNLTTGSLWSLSMSFSILYEETGSKDKSFFSAWQWCWMLKGRLLLSLGNEEWDENISSWQWYCWWCHFSDIRWLAQKYCFQS